MTDLIERLRGSRAVWKDARSAPTDLESEAADALESASAEHGVMLEALESISSINYGRWWEMHMHARTALKRVSTLQSKDDGS